MGGGSLLEEDRKEEAQQQAETTGGMMTIHPEGPCRLTSLSLSGGRKRKQGATCSGGVDFCANLDAAGGAAGRDDDGRIGTRPWKAWRHTLIVRSALDTKLV